MKKLMTILVLSTLIIPFTLFNLSAEEKVIYGDDDRIDYNAMPASMKNLADGVVSLWESSKVTLEEGSYNLNTRIFGDVMNLCPEERFIEQKMGAFCSGSLVGDDIIMTAGHCITDETDCKKTKFVFGFAKKSRFFFNFDSLSSVPEKISPDNVYSCKHIINRFLAGENNDENDNRIALGADYALIKLDRTVIGRTPLRINRVTDIKNETDLFVIGHPMGLPVKLAGGASVRDASPKDYFVANLDTYGGNSGSPVFNAKTKLIEGILVRGETDFVETNEGCSVSNELPQDGGRGEDVTKISALASFIPELSKKTLTKTVAKNIKIDNILNEDMGDFIIPMPVFE